MSKTIEFCDHLVDCGSCNVIDQNKPSLALKLEESSVRIDETTNTNVIYACNAEGTGKMKDCDSYCPVKIKIK